MSQNSQETVALTEKPAHTPGPWTVGGINGIGQLAVKAADGARIALVDEQWLASSAANAALIVRAVNAHADLLAFAQLIGRMTTVEEQGETASADDAQETLNNLIASARQIVAKAGAA